MVVNRSSIAAAWFATALVLQMTNPVLSSWVLVLTWGLMAGGVLIAPRSIGPRWVYAGLLLIIASAFAAIPGTYLWGDSKPVQTAIIALLTAPLIIYYLANNAHVVFRCLQPVWLIHAGFVLFQGFTQAGRASGITSNPNPAGAFLVLGAIFFLAGKQKWLALPLIAALPITGARWSVVVLTAIILGMVVSGHLSWRYVGFIAVISIILVGFGYGLISENYRIDEMSFIPVNINRDISARMPLIRVPSFAPRGHTDDGYPKETPHNVPLRMSIETGILSGLAWMVITGWALWKGPRGDVGWWLLMGLFALSQFYYFPWIERMGGFWWLLIGWRIKGSTRADRISEQ